MHVTTSVVLDALLPGGRRERQLVRSTPSYWGSPWYEHVAFNLNRDAPNQDVRYGQVLLLLRREEGDVAVVAQLLPVAVQEGPLPERGCTILRWSMGTCGGARDGGVALILVPVTDILRIVHVVPVLRIY